MDDDNLYVPPVREQIANLPTKDVLLRGSNLPTASSDGLLRAAHPRTTDSPGELLRANEPPTDEKVPQRIKDAVL